MTSVVLRSLGRRVAGGVLLLWLVSSGALLLARLAPGDFADDLVTSGVSAPVITQIRQGARLDRPVLEQYFAWLSGAVRLDFGTSLAYGRPVRELVIERAWNTGLLAIAALALAVGIGLPLGVVAGSSRGWAAHGIAAFSAVAVSVPSLVTSMILMWIAARTGWFPIGGMPPAESDASLLTRAVQSGWYLAAPTLALAVPMMAVIERVQSDSVGRALVMPFVAAARARGIGDARLVWRHALRPSLGPLASIFGLMIGAALSGSFAVEMVTAWPGLGRLMYQALLMRDLYLVAGCAAAGAVFLAIGTLAADAASLAIEPRLRDR